MMEPCPIRHRLTGVKRAVFNPDLPSLRRMERDDVMCKLPEEHCRHTTRCTAQQFADAHNRPFPLPDRDLHCLRTITGRINISRAYNSLEDLQEAHSNWSRHGDPSCLGGGSFQKNLQKFSNNANVDDWHFDGVMLKMIKPQLKDWRFTFKCEPGLDRSGKVQRVVPSNTQNRHRFLEPSYNHCRQAVCNRCQ